MIKQYFSNILDEQIGIYWTGNEYYPASILSIEEKKEIDKVSCLKYSFEKHETNFEENIEQLLAILFDSSLSNIYQIYLDFSAEYPNKIRSYKGVISKKENDVNSFIEVELPYKDKTIIGGIIQLFKPIYPKNINLILDNRKGFILSSNANLFSKYQIENIIREYRIESSQTSINYLKLIIDVCTSGEKLYMFSNFQNGLSMACFTLK